MRESSYAERDYTFGQMILTLRTSIGLTQMGLADQLGVSRNAVAQWEGGGSYPKAEHLKHLIELAMQASAFPAKREAEVIRQLWGAAHQRVLLDEQWLLVLLGHEAPSPTEPTDQDIRQAEVISAQGVALWTVPFARNPHFTGRDTLLDQLAAQLTSSVSNPAMTIRRVALTQAQIVKGLGGIGKTQIAVEYAYRARSQGRYTHVFWIAAATEETLLMSFTALAEQLPDFSPPEKPEQLVAAVIGWLQQCHEPWLLILDNADDLSLVQPFLPLQGNGSILLTTRANAVGSLGPSLEVDIMGLLEGAELLLRRAQRFAQASDAEINEAVNLVGALGQFPLALDQAGAYIEETGCSLADYLQLYQTHRHALLSRRGMQASRYPASVATTWKLSFEHIEANDPAAADLLQLLAYLSPDHIPEELLTESAKEWPLALQQIIADRFRFNQAISTLLAFSLVKRLSEDRLLSIHRLVQVVQRERMEPEEQRQWAERVVRAMNMAFPKAPQETASWPQCSRYLDQVQTCDALIEEYHLISPEAADLLTRAGTYLRERGLYTLAEPLYLHALAICKEQEQPESLQMAATLTQLGFLYHSTGRTSQVEMFYQRALVIHEHLLGQDHEQTVASLYSLASLYEAQRRPKEAEELALRVLAMREKLLGPEHLDTITTLDFLAMLYMTLGCYEKAESLFQRVLVIREQQLGRNHLETARSLNGLGIIYLKQGKYAQVEPLYQRVLQILEQHLGETHPRTMTMWQNLANLSRLQGRYEEAEQRTLHVLAFREQMFGPLHPYTADSLALLAEIYQQQRKLAEAEQTIRRALDIRENHADPDEINLATTLHVLGLVSRDQGRLSEAEAAFQCALTIREQMLAPTHTDLAQTLHGLALVHQLQGRLEEARVLYARALLVRTQTMGQDHPETRDTQERLDTVLIALGWLEETVPMQTANAEQ